MEKTKVINLQKAILICNKNSYDHILNNNIYNNENSLLTYFKQIAIHKLRVEKRTIKSYLQFISMKKENFQADFF